MNTGVNNMRLDRENARWLGVCAGIANWLDVPATLVRIVFVICVISWPPFLIGYFILYFCLDKDLTPEKMQDYFSSAPTAEHFRKLNYRKPIYKNERDKRIAGVCAGIAEYLEVSAFSVRVVTLLSLFIFGPFTFWAYIICMFVFDPDPHGADQDAYQDKMSRRERRRQRRADRYARRQARRDARAARRTRKSYANEEVQDDISDFEEVIQDAAADVHLDLRAEIDSAFSGFKKSNTKRSGQEEAIDPRPNFNRSECTEIYSTLEKRLREIEAFMTSKKFRLHCQLNRI
jgi:phage shock protein C